MSSAEGIVHNRVAVVKHGCMHGAAYMSDALGCWVTGLTVADDISVSAIVGARPSMGEDKSRCTVEEARGRLDTLGGARRSMPWRGSVVCSTVAKLGMQS